jgi:ATP-binding cassette subfamily B protein
MKIIFGIIKLCTDMVRRLLLVSLVLGIITSALSVYVNVAFGRLAEKFLLIEPGNNSSSKPVVGVLLVILIVYILVAVLSYFQERSSDSFRFTALNQLRRVGYEKMQRLPFEYFQNNRSGTIVNRTLYVASVVNWLADLTEFRISSIMIPVFSIGTFYFFDPIIGVVTTVGVVVTIFLQMRKTTKRKPYLRAGNDAWDDAVGIYNEHISQVATSRSTVNQKNLTNIFYKSLEVQLGFRRKQNSVEWHYNLAQMTLEAFIICGILSLTVFLAIRGSITIAILVSITAMIRNIMMNSRAISQIYDSYINATTEGKKYYDLVHEPESPIELHRGKRLRTIESVELRSVGFEYTKEQGAVLKNISLTIRNKQKIGIVGVSGGGKSTLAKLLTRLHEPSSGEIRINDEPIGSYSTSSIRENIGVVLQDVSLYHISVAGNIRLARPSATDADIAAALKSAYAWEFVKALPDGMNTIVGERGVKLSGGQRQRIAIARAIIKDPSFVVLDEATSALDSVAEKEVQKGLKSLMADKPSLVIAHRLSTILDCDKIYVIDEGTIVEQGTHRDLIAKKGEYAKLWEHQSGGFIA